jgi:hypothetical protein
MLATTFFGQRVLASRYRRDVDVLTLVLAYWSRPGRYRRSFSHWILVANDAL